ncbi:MAG: Spy/CpxP family protein refolding chaperone [Azoarcus sp.]|nr:Spy/CpxP family protein refolding chaperone [Azoarcus sp.]
MKFWIRTSLVAALAASALIGGTAMAAPDGCAHGGWHGDVAAWRGASPEQVKERLTRRAESRLARLELALALKPEQQAAWADFRKAAIAHTLAVAESVASQHKADAPKTALERLDRLEDVNRRHAGLLADTRKAVEAFYGHLGGAQKTVFDDEFSKFYAGAGRDGHFGKGERRSKGEKRGKDKKD